MAPQTGESSGSVLPEFSWREVKQHTKHDDRWIVIDGQVYDVTRWARRHPGGAKIIGHFSGQDATEAYRAFHKEAARSDKYLNALHVGSLTSEDAGHSPVDEDFRKLQRTVKEMGLYKPNYWFFSLHLLHILVLDLAGCMLMYYLGTGWLPYLGSLLLLGTAQTQAAWLQHDFGHYSVFPTTTLDRLMHNLLMGSFKGAGPHWWRHMHNQHHAKPNVINKDPDVRIEKVFVVGENMPKMVAEQLRKSMPYDWQHRYFFLIGPPLLFPVYFQFMVFYFTISRKYWKDLAWMMVLYIKFLCVFVPLLGVGSTIIFFFAVRCFESHWFTWVSQSNHIPMNIEEDNEKPWLPLQIRATCDIEQSWFNDWFTGHLNFQCEHHLFPTMPRHNYHKVAPLVRSLCKKHNIPYHVKPLRKAFGDIIGSLKHSGELWAHAYAEAYGM